MTTTPDDGDDRRDDPDRLNDPQAVEEAFDAIVANIDRPEVGPTPWPDVEGEGRAGEPPASMPSEPPLRTPRPDWEGWDDVRPAELESSEAADLDDADDEHYVPPPPPPVPRGDRVIRWAWAGALGAPLLAILLPLIGWPIDGLVGALLVAAFLGGFITLISRLRSGPRIDDGPDDGAVV